MEELFSDNKLGQLEERIDSLLAIFRGMKEEKENLSGKVDALETQNRELKEQMARVEAEKTVIMEKVRGILEKIEKIEV